MNQQEIIAQAVKYEDQSKVKVQKSIQTVIPKGKTVCRLLEYVELGLQPQKPYKGTAKKPCEQVRVVFELLGPKNIREIEVDGQKKLIADKLFLTLPKIMGDKAKFFKLFNKLKYGRDNITHMAQMLGEAFTVEIFHRGSTAPVNPGEEPKVYANPNSEDGEFTFGAPRLEDPITGEVKILDVPALMSPTKVFVWAFPDKESWDSLFIDGTYKKNGQDVSKNFIQEAILGALNFKGSELDELLNGSKELSDALDGIL